MRYPIDPLLIIVLLIILILLLIFLLLKKKRRTGGGIRKTPVNLDKQHRLPRFNPNEEVIFFLEKKADIDNFKLALTDRFLFRGGEPEIVYPCPCSDVIIRVKGITPGVIGQPDQSQNGTGDKTPPGLQESGTFGGAQYCPNYYFDLPLNHNAASLNGLYCRPLQDVPDGEPVLVAVLDTGLDPTVAKKYQPQVESTCIKEGEKGYNFIDDNSNTADDFGSGPCGALYQGHGTPVTGLILQMAAAEVNVKILPVKCLDKNGHATLIQVMCALAYAKNAGAKIINLSLGFYSPLSEYVDLFKRFLTEHITNDNTIIVAAAGNCNSEEDTQAMAAPENLLEDDLRNLDKHLFFPAAFSDTNSNIISVTTISPQTAPSIANGTFTVCPRQNYSVGKVQVGVAADTADYCFMDAFMPANDKEPLKTWLGSSFATPVVTGLLAATYNRFLADGKVYDRDEYFDWLQNNMGNIFRETATLSLASNDANAKLPHWLLIRGTAEKHLITMSNKADVAATTMV